MTLILNGTDNSATTPAVTGTDTDTGVYYPSAGALAIATNGTLRLQVNSGGDTCFNNSSFSTSVNCLSINSGRMFINKSDDWAIEMSGANATRIRLYSSDGGQTTTVGSIQVNTTSALYNAGDVQLNSSGVTFPATQVASGNANTLDDYEEGTFTPALTAGTTNPTVTYVVQSGNYTKVGRVVSISARLQISAISGGSGAIRISGLPFANAMGICGAHASWISTLTLPVGTTWADTYFEGNDLHLCIAASGTTAGAQQLSIGAVGASFDTSIQFTYQTS